jgi:SAM-dependent methyltransferase
METAQGHDAQDRPEYVLGHSEPELERLIAQARIYQPFTTQVFRDAGLAPGMRVLDVGSGAGDVSFLAARMVEPTGQVVGVDRSPDAVSTASRRALALELPNTHFVVGNAASMTFEAPFDAVVGRLVLLFSPDPAAMVRQVAAQVRPGGVIVFQEPDWTGYRSLPVLPTWDSCARWIIAALQGSGADPYLGLKLSTIFTSAGLPPPTLYMNAAIAAGPDHSLSVHAADLVRALQPAMEQLSIASAGEVDIDTLDARLRVELAASSGAVVWLTVIGAVVRKPAEQ